MIEWIINLTVVGILLLMSVLIKFFKNYNLISGYNSASPEEQAYMVEKGIGNFMSRQFLLMALAWLNGFWLHKTGFAWGVEFGVILLLILVIYTVVGVQNYLPPPSFYKSKDSRELAENRAKQRKLILWVSAFFTVLVLSLVGWSAMPSTISVEDGRLDVSGAYGINVSLSDLEQVELRDSLPEIGKRTNGLSFGPVLKGHFQVEGLGKTRLLLRSSETPPFLFLKIKNQPESIFINMANPNETAQLYQQLKKPNS